MAQNKAAASLEGADKSSEGTPSPGGAKEFGGSPSGARDSEGTPSPGGAKEFSISGTVARIFEGYVAHRTRAIEQVTRDILAEIHKGEFHISWEHARSKFPHLHTMVHVAEEDASVLPAVCGFGAQMAQVVADGARRDVEVVLSPENAVFVDAVVQRLTPVLACVLKACEAKAKSGENVRYYKTQPCEEIPARERMFVVFGMEEFNGLMTGCGGDSVATMQVVCGHLCPDTVNVHRRAVSVEVEINRSCC